MEGRGTLNLEFEAPGVPPYLGGPVGRFKVSGGDVGRRIQLRFTAAESAPCNCTIAEFGEGL